MRGIEPPKLLLPGDRGDARDLKEITPIEISKKKAGARIEHEISERVEEKISGIVRHNDRAIHVEAEKPPGSAAMRDIGALSSRFSTRRMRGDEEGVCAADQRTGPTIEPREAFACIRCASAESRAG